MGDFRPELRPVELLGSAMALDACLFVRDLPPGCKKRFAIRHHLPAYVLGSRSVAGFAADAFFTAGGRGKERIGLLGTGYVTQQAPVVSDGFLEVRVVRSRFRQEQRPIGGEVPIGMGVASAHPEHVLVSFFGTCVAAHAGLRSHISGCIRPGGAHGPPEKIQFDRFDFTIFGSFEPHHPGFLTAGETVGADGVEVVRCILADPKPVALAPDFDCESVAKIIEIDVFLEAIRVDRDFGRTRAKDLFRRQSFIIQEVRVSATFEEEINRALLPAS